MKLSRKVNGSSGGTCLLSLLLDIKRSVYIRSVALVTFGLLVLAGYGSGQESRPQAPEVETPTETRETTPIAADKKPNVVFILADNVGYGDLGSYGGGELRGAPTPRLDQLAQQGLRLTQFLVEPACTPSRAALMTGQYSIRNSLSLIIIPGTPSTLPANAFTMGQMFKGVGYATAIFGKWHLGSEPQSLPTAHGFDEFYGIPPDTSWDASTYVTTIELTHSIPAPPEILLAKGPQIYEATAGGPLRTVKPFTEEVRAEIDYELTDKAIDFMKRQKAAGKPFFLYLPFSMGHVPNLPGKALLESPGSATTAIS